MASDIYSCDGWIVDEYLGNDWIDGWLVFDTRAYRMSEIILLEAEEVEGDDLCDKLLIFLRGIEQPRVEYIQKELIDSFVRVLVRILRGNVTREDFDRELEERHRGENKKEFAEAIKQGALVPCIDKPFKCSECDEGDREPVNYIATKVNGTSHNYCGKCVMWNAYDYLKENQAEATND